MFIVFIHNIHEFYFGLIFVRLGVGRESAVKVSSWTKDQNYLWQYLVWISLWMEAINADANNIENTYKRSLTVKFSHLPLPFTKGSFIGHKNIIYETQN